MERAVVHPVLHPDAPAIYAIVCGGRHCKNELLFYHPAFTVGKFISNSVAVFKGLYASENTNSIL